MAVIAFDLDGTLFRTKRGVDWNSRESVRASSEPDFEMVGIANDLSARGHKLAYVTGRARGLLYGLTLVQIRIHAGLPAGPLRMQSKFTDYAAMAAWKAKELGDLEASLYVGDHEADRDAARLAGIPFLHVDEVRRGALLSDKTAEGTVDVFGTSDKPGISKASPPSS